MFVFFYCSHKESNYSGLFGFLPEGLWSLALPDCSQQAAVGSFQ